MPLPLSEGPLNDAAILARAETHGLSLYGEPQMEFLRRLDSFDMQAAPGCGKTTLTGLKLCLVASGWRSRTQGVCVISHTNVAKDQIAGILKGDGDGRSILGYPHFVGTIQGFVDTFLALPYLRSGGADIRSIDDDFYVRASMAELREADYATLRGLIYGRNPRTDIKALVQTAHYVWTGTELAIKGTLNGRASDYPFAAASASANQFHLLKAALSKQGIYRYADMFAFASQHLAANTRLANALHRRFPLVLIDEMQDTSRLQEELLNTIFDPKECVVQRIGDVNQRIYMEAGDDEADDAQFPATGFLSLPRSMRFGDIIASAASPLTVAAAQQLEGNPNRPNTASVLIAFDQESVADVIPAFGKLVIDKVSPEELAAYSVKAIGARRSGDAQQFPRAIGCYHLGYNPEPRRASKPLSLAMAVVSSRAMDAMDWHDASCKLWDACCEILVRWEYSIDGRRPTVPRLKAALAKGSHDAHLAVRMGILQVAGVDWQNKQDWDEAAHMLCEALRTALDLEPPTRNVANYCAFSAKAAMADNSKAGFCEGFLVEYGGKSLNVQLGTIHAAKGETHAATLVLECYHRIHDLAEVMPMLVSKHDRRRVARTQSILPAARRTFVAMTRPRNLLAFAVHKDHIAHLLTDFEKAGWYLVDLTSTNTAARSD